MMDDSGRMRTVPDRAIAGCGAVSALLFGKMFLLDGPAFTRSFPRSGPQWAIPDFQFFGYDQAYVQNLRTALEDNPVASEVMRSVHLGADLLFPLLFGLFLGLLLVRFRTGTFFFGLAMSRQLMLMLPLAYGISDYAENIAILLYFQPSQPSPVVQDQFSMQLPWLTRLKFMFVATTALILVRQLLFNRVVAKSGYR